MARCPTCVDVWTGLPLLSNAAVICSLPHISSRPASQGAAEGTGRVAAGCGDAPERE